MKSFLVAVPFLLALLAVCRADTPRKKFVEVDGTTPPTSFLREHFREMEQAPFDGVVFKVEATDDDGEQHSSLSAWDAKPWKREWFQTAIDDLRACKFTTFTNNFLRVDATPADLDWADDAGWSALVEKVAIFAWITKQGGAKGVCFDFEGAGVKSFRFLRENGRTFVATAALVRKRGRETMRALAREFPDQTVLAFWLNSVNFNTGANNGTDEILAWETYGLLPAFIDGLLDELPPTMTLIDGCEFGYYMDSELEYQRAAGKMRQWNGPTACLVAPENREKWRRQVQAGFGFYLDMFLNEPGNHYYFPPLDGSRLKRLARNLAAARDAGDEYVWVYGEQCRWWPKPPDGWLETVDKKSVGQGRMWEETIPGITTEVAWARDPISAARVELKEPHRNLARNPQFAANIDEYVTWQDKESNGVLEWDEKIGDGSARATRVKKGGFTQKLRVTPGESYAIEAASLSRGAGEAKLMIRWQLGDNIMTRLVRTFPFSETEGEWREAFGVVTVPAGADQLVVVLSIEDQVTDDDVCWFDDVAIYAVHTDK